MTNTYIIISTALKKEKFQNNKKKNKMTFRNK